MNRKQLIGACGWEDKMYKILSIVLVVFLFIGCDNAAASKKMPLEDKIKKQQRHNFMNEEIELLALKYKVDIKILINAVDDYEKLVYGSSSTKRFYQIGEQENIENKPTSQNETVLDIPTAIETISYKYQIPKEVFVDILIDKKMLESNSE